MNNFHFIDIFVKIFYIPIFVFNDISNHATNISSLLFQIKQYLFGLFKFPTHWPVCTVNLWFIRWCWVIRGCFFWFLQRLQHGRRLPEFWSHQSSPPHSPSLLPRPPPRSSQTLLLHHSTTTPPSSTRAPAAVLSTATCFYTTPTLISTSIWVIMLLACMPNVGHWIMPTNCLMKCRTGILFPGLLSFLGMPSMVGLMSVLGSLGTCWFGTGQRSLRLPAWLALVVGTAIVDGRYTRLRWRLLLIVVFMWGMLLLWFRSLLSLLTNHKPHRRNGQWNIHITENADRSEIKALDQPESQWRTLQKKEHR